MTIPNFALAVCESCGSETSPTGRCRTCVVQLCVDLAELRKAPEVTFPGPRLERPRLSEQESTYRAPGAGTPTLGGAA